MLIILNIPNTIVSHKTCLIKKTHKNSFCSTTPPKHIFRLSDSATCSPHHHKSQRESSHKPRHKKAWLQCKRYLDRSHHTIIIQYQHHSFSFLISEISVVDFVIGIRTSSTTSHFVYLSRLIFLSAAENRGCVSEEDMSDSVFGFCLLAHHNLSHQLNFIPKTKINTTSKWRHIWIALSGCGVDFCLLHKI